MQGPMSLSTGGRLNQQNQTPSSLLGAGGRKRKREDVEGLRPGAFRGSLYIPGRVTSLTNLNGVNVALVHGPPKKIFCISLNEDSKNQL